MDPFLIATILIVIAALFSCLNIKLLKLPNTIGLVIITIIASLCAIVISFFDDTFLQAVKQFISHIDFTHILLDIMLSFLLFTGSFHTNLKQLKVQRLAIIIFATLGTLVSTFLVGGFTYLILPIIGLPIDFIYCLLFGALISPTDPIAVLGILKQAGIPKRLENIIVGESLFNDGVGVVIFLTVFKIAESKKSNLELFNVFHLFGQEVLGGIIFGILLGWLNARLLRIIDDYSVQIIITLATIMGGTILAQHFHFSAPLSMVAIGLIVGNNPTKNDSKSKMTALYINKFWELVDILLNAILFVMIGLELLILIYNEDYLIASLLVLPLVLFSRYLSLFLPIFILRKRLKFVPKMEIIMTWGGLRGGISIALALSLTSDMHRELFLVITYMIVIFSIIIQGLSIEPLVKNLDLKIKK